MRILNDVRGRMDRLLDNPAQEAYFNADRQAGRIYAQLSKPMPAADRADLLFGLYVALDDAARVHRDAFGPAPIPHEGGRDLADSQASGALLIALLADVEHAVAFVEPRQLTDSVLEESAGWVLDWMVQKPDPVSRARLLDELYEAVVDVVGGQAAEVVGRLPAPGRNIPVTFRQHFGPLLAAQIPNLRWAAAVIAAAFLAAIAPGDDATGVGMAMGAAAAVGLIPRLRPAWMSWKASVPWAYALGLLVGAQVHHIGERSLVASVAVVAIAAAAASQRIWPRE